MSTLSEELNVDKGWRRKPGRGKWIGNFCLDAFGGMGQGIGEEWCSTTGKKLENAGCKWRGDNEIHIKIICWKEKSQVELDVERVWKVGSLGGELFAQRVEVF